MNAIQFYLFITFLCFPLIYGDSQLTGEVTAYGNDYKGGNCGFTQISSQLRSSGETYFVALSSADWDNGMDCGRCIEATCTSSECQGGTPTIMYVTNKCPECKQGDLDMSDAAFLKVTGTSPSRYQVSWKFVTCPNDFVSGNVELYLKGGSNANWIAVQPRNSLKKIAQVVIHIGNSKHNFLTPAENSIDSYYFLGENYALSGSFSIDLIAEDGETISSSFSSLWAADTSTDMGTQFGGESSTRTINAISTENEVNPSPSSTFQEEPQVNTDVLAFLQKWAELLPKNTSPTTTSRSTVQSSEGSSCSALYAQCGGQGWFGATCCQEPAVCKELNPYYFQCLPESNMGVTGGESTSKRNFRGPTL